MRLKFNRKRPKTEKVGTCPINARITVDYSGKKPKIKFGYFAKKHQSHTELYSLPVTILSMTLWLISVMFIADIYYNTSDRPEIGTCQTSELYYKGHTEVIAFDIVCNGELGPSSNKEYYLTFDRGRLIQTQGFRSDLGYMLLGAGAFFICWFISINLFKYVPYLAKKNQKWTPNLAALMARVKYSAVFNKCPENKIIEIPLFNNIFLDYRATKEFAKNLLRVEIREHPFNYHIKRERKRGKDGKRGKRKDVKVRNFWLWRAQFIFKEIPHKGKLEVRWA
jgi:hypothetical protein